MSYAIWRKLALDPPRVEEPPAGSATIRSLPEDFQVDEELGFIPSGKGEHVLLRVRKREANTPWVARELGRIGGVRTSDVGFAGLKDRRAVTTQWFTVPARSKTAADWLGLCGEGYEVIEAQAHHRKLPRGALSGNRFRIVLRNFKGDRQLFERRIASVRVEGVPNYFGPQRFGHNLSNLSILEDGRSPRAQELSFVLSAARSLIFNAVLAARVKDGSWHSLIPGERANLDGTNSLFAVDALNENITARLAALDIHPTGPMWGLGKSVIFGEVAELEEFISLQHIILRELIASAAVDASRRPLRIAVRDLSFQWYADFKVCELCFSLRAGSFATSVLREFLIPEGSQGEDDHA